MEIDASSPQGNVFVVMGIVQKLLTDVGRGAEWPAIQERMMSGNYDNACNVAEEVTNGSVRVVNR